MINMVFILLKIIKIKINFSFLIIKILLTLTYLVDRNLIILIHQLLIIQTTIYIALIKILIRNENKNNS